MEFINKPCEQKSDATKWRMSKVQENKEKKELEREKKPSKKLLW